MYIFKLENVFFPLISLWEVNTKWLCIQGGFYQKHSPGTGKGPCLQAESICRKPQQSCRSYPRWTNLDWFCLQCLPSELALLPTLNHTQRKSLWAVFHHLLEYLPLWLCWHSYVWPLQKVRKKQEPGLRNPRGKYRAWYKWLWNE